MRSVFVILSFFAIYSWAQGIGREGAIQLNNKALEMMPAAHSDPKAAQHVLAILDSAIAKDSLYHVAYYNKVMLLCELGRREAALRTLQRLSALIPDYVDAWTFQGLILERSGRIKEARRNYEVALEKLDRLIDGSSDSLRVRREIGRATVMLYYKGKKAGLREYERIVAMHPDNKFVAAFRQSFVSFDKRKFLRNFCK